MLQTKNDHEYHRLTVGGLGHVCATNDSPLDRPFGHPFDGARFAWAARFSNESKMTLLAGVCRQLHQETSLMVYELNLFSFHDHCVMRDCLGSLRASQKKSIRRICLPSPYWFLLKTHQKQLSGLREMFFYNGSTTRVRCTVYGSPGIQKPISGGEAYDWARVEDNGDSG